MKLTKKQLKKIEGFALNYYKKSDYAHNIDHASRTVKLAEYIAKKEKANIEICSIAALLHQFHDTEGVEDFLNKIKVDENLIKQIIHCVRCCSTYNIYRAKTIEAKVVFDADFLQTLGPLGIYRMLSTVPFGKLSLEILANKIQKMQEERFERLQTKTGKKMVEKLHKSDLEFYKLFKKWYKVK